MVDKYTLYRFIAPFRSWHQSCLREERKDVDIVAFARGFENGDRHAEVIRSLWDLLREDAFVRDFRPDPDDDLLKIYGMGPEEVLHDVFEPLLTKFGLSAAEIDLTGFDFSSIATPKDVGVFLMRTVETHDGNCRQREGGR